MTKLNKKKNIYNLEIQRQAEYIVSNFIAITNTKTDHIPMPLLDVLITFVYNPGYYNDYKHFFNQVKKHIKAILLSKGVERTRMSTKSYLFIENPLFNHYVEMYDRSSCERRDEKYNSNRILSFSNALLKWPYHDSSFDDIHVLPQVSTKSKNSKT